MRFRIVIVAAAVLCIGALLDRAGPVASARLPQIAPVGGKAAAFAIAKPGRVDVNTGIARSSPVFEPGYDHPFHLQSERTAAGRDGRMSTAKFSAHPMPTPILSFDGLSNFDNVNFFGLIVAPPDMVGDVGPRHYVQIVNILFRVFDKKGLPLTPPMPIKSLFTALGTPCSQRNDGLPNVLYDQLADRWLISQVCSIYPPFRQMIAVSKTGDPAAEWFAYEFVMPNVRINDFPKISMWPDGYYMTTDEYLGSDYVGSGVFAFDRNKMLAGDPAAGYVYVSYHAPAPSRRRGMLAADLDGLRFPPDGTPAIIASYQANEYGDAQDAIRLFDFDVDFDAPSNSTFTERPESPIAVEPFDPTSPSGRADIAQPPPGAPLDSVSDTLGYRLAYRNHDSYQALVVNQTVRTTPPEQVYRAGVRLYEFRNSSGSYSPFVQNTLGDAGSSRWIASAAQDHQGNTAMQYNYVSDEKEVSILYSGRLKNDFANTLRQEGTIVTSTGVQRGFGWRWGEYSGMAVDPVDDCTFWMTNAYYTFESQNFSDFGWLTRIGTFKFDECSPAPRATVRGKVTNAANGQPVAGATVDTSRYSRTTSTDGAYDLMLVPGTFSLSVSAHGFRSQVVNLSLKGGDTLIRNFALEPVPILVNTGFDVSAESCGINGAPEPGESLTVSVTLRNTGTIPTQALVAALRSAGGVIDPGPPQNFGAIPVGGTATRSFSFTVSKEIECGSPVTLTLALSDGGSDLGDLTIPLQTGVPRIALRESFDRTLMGALPARWTRTATGNLGQVDEGRNWRISNRRPWSPTKSLFVPTPSQFGVSEVASPVFQIATNEARLTFRNWYELETTFLRNRVFDGTVLEIRFDGGEWQDILAAGCAFESGGYDGPIDACCSNPLAGRLAWSGWSGINRPAEYVTTSVKLPASAAGRKVQFRWRTATDIGTGREGQYIDDVLVTDGRTCGC